jgi:hypothetical protein
MGSKSADSSIDQINVGTRFQFNPCLLKQPGTVSSLLFGRESFSCQRTSHSMWECLKTNWAQWLPLSVKQWIARLEAAAEISSLNHPAIERVRLPLRLRWCSKGIEAFGGKRSLTGPSSASETPSAGGINTNHRSLEPPAPLGDICCNERGELLAILPVLECDGMKTLLGTADINTDDDGTRISVTHYDPCPTVKWPYNVSFPRSFAINRNCSSAASKSSTISWAMMSGLGRLAESSSESSLSQKMSRLALSRAMSSS